MFVNDAGPVRGFLTREEYLELCTKKRGRRDASGRLLPPPHVRPPKTTLHKSLDSPCSLCSKVLTRAKDCLCRLSEGAFT
jgi:hypothetical protein